jgi:hypothetical protein
LDICFSTDVPFVPRGVFKPSTKLPSNTTLQTVNAASVAQYLTSILTSNNTYLAERKVTPPHQPIMSTPHGTIHTDPSGNSLSGYLHRPSFNQVISHPNPTRHPGVLAIKKLPTAYMRENRLVDTGASKSQSGMPSTSAVGGGIPVSSKFFYLRKPNPRGSTAKDRESQALKLSQADYDRAGLSGGPKSRLSHTLSDDDDVAERKNSDFDAGEDDEDYMKLSNSSSDAASCCICTTTDFVDPWLSACGHICCSECWITWLKENPDHLCPECDELVTLEELRPVQLCPICSLVPKNPWTSACGHTACLDCWTKWLNEDSRCMECGKNVSKQTLPTA